MALLREPVAVAAAVPLDEGPGRPLEGAEREEPAPAVEVPVRAPSVPLRVSVDAVVPLEDDVGRPLGGAVRLD